MTFAAGSFALALLLVVPSAALPGLEAAVSAPDLAVLCNDLLPPSICTFLGLEEPTPPGHVHMASNQFNPADLTIQAGETVTWHNHDGLPHTATSSDNPPLFNSGDVPNGGTFAFTFDTPGTYDYFCTYHTLQGMTGTIVVEA